MRATCLVLILAITAFSYPLPLDPVRDFIEGAHLTFASTPIANPECLDLASQTDLYNTLEKAFVDFGEDKSVHTFVNDLLKSLPDLAGIMADCKIDSFANAFSESFRFGGDKLFARISKEFTTLSALYGDLERLLGENQFKLAGEQFGNIMKLIIEPAPEEIMMLGVQKTASFESNLGKFVSGLALGLQSKPTPLSKCYNTTTSLGGSAHNVHTMGSQCIRFNFTACNELPAFLTIFNAGITDIWNSCKVEELITNIDGLNTPTRLSETVFIYFSNQVQITTWMNQFEKARTTGDYSTMGTTLGDILRVLLKFSVS